MTSEHPEVEQDPHTITLEYFPFDWLDCPVLVQDLLGNESAKK